MPAYHSTRATPAHPPAIPPTLAAAVQAALDILGRASADWRNGGQSAEGSLHWPVAVAHARKLLKTAVLALSEAEKADSGILPEDTARSIEEYNALTEAQRRHWHRIAGSAVPAEAWAAWKAHRDSL